VHVSQTLDALNKGAEALPGFYDGRAFFLRGQVTGRRELSYDGHGVDMLIS
jgi:hypothetical protein